MYANSNFKKEVNEFGQVTKWIKPGEEISQGDLNVGDEEWDELVKSGAVVENYPEALKDSPQTPPAEYFKQNPDEAPELGVDETTPVHEAMGKLDTAGDSGQKLPGANEGEGQQNDEGKKAPWQS